MPYAFCLLPSAFCLTPSATMQMEGYIARARGLVEDAVALYRPRRFALVLDVGRLSALCLMPYA